MNSSTQLKFTCNGVEYTWRGGFGNVIESVERPIGNGEFLTRQICGTTFHVFRMDRPIFSRKATIMWSIKEPNVESLMQFKRRAFCCDSPWEKKQ